MTGAPEREAPSRNERRRRFVAVTALLAGLATAAALVASLLVRHWTCFSAWQSPSPNIIGEWENVSPLSEFDRVSLPPRVGFSADDRYRTLDTAADESRFWATGSYHLEGSRLTIAADLYGSRFDVATVEVSRFGCDLIITYGDRTRLHYRRIH